MKYKRMIAILLVIASLALAGCKSADYEEAVEFFEDEKYEDAIALFEEFGEYEDSLEYLEKANYLLAVELYEDGDYIDSFSLFQANPEYEDSATYIQSCAWSIVENHVNDEGMPAASARSLLANNNLIIMTVPEYPGKILLARNLTDTFHQFTGTYFPCDLAFCLYIYYDDIGTEKYAEWTWDATLYNPYTDEQEVFSTNNCQGTVEVEKWPAYESFTALSVEVDFYNGLTWSGHDAATISKIQSLCKGAIDSFAKWLQGDFYEATGVEITMADLGFISYDTAE